MLARFLRKTIFSQLFLGLVIGLALQYFGVIPPWMAVCIAIGLPFAVMILLDTYTGFLSRSTEPLGDWFSSLIGEYRAGILVFILRQPWAIQPPVLLPATGGQKRIPVVLVHGYLCNHRVWDEVVPVLRARGHDVFAINLEPLFCSIDRYGPLLESAVKALLEGSSYKQVAFIGHSMGGLAIRAWLRTYGSTQAARVLTLGTPHVGTRVGDNLPPSAHTPNGLQMAWNSDWLQQLAASETKATRTLFRIALTPQDNIVYPQRPQVLQGVEPSVFPGIGHVQMCLDPDVITWCANQLQDITL